MAIMGGETRHLLMPHALTIMVIIILHTQEMTLLLPTEGATDGVVVGDGEI